MIEGERGDVEGIQTLGTERGDVEGIQTLGTELQ